MCPGKAPACSARPPLTSPGWTLLPGPGQAVFSVSTLSCPSDCKKEQLCVCVSQRMCVFLSEPWFCYHGALSTGRVRFLSIMCTHSHPAVCLFMCLACFVSVSEWVGECIYTSGCLFFLWMTSHDWQLFQTMQGLNPPMCPENNKRQHPSRTLHWQIEGKWASKSHGCNQANKPKHRASVS